MFPQVTDQNLEGLKKRNWTAITTEALTAEPWRQVENLKVGHLLHYDLCHVGSHGCLVAICLYSCAASNDGGVCSFNMKHYIIHLMNVVPGLMVLW